MKRLCVFAHYDRDNLVDDYVIFYLKELKSICSSLVFISDCTLSLSERSKLDGIADFVLAQKHGEYDFGSYKRGLQLATEKKLEYDELIFANDSCYGPFFPLKPIFEKMEKKHCDFWGMTQNRYGIKKSPDGTGLPCVSPHVQSYFIVFNKNVFQSETFISFINSIEKETEKNSIIVKYEVGLSKLLYKEGFKSAVYINKYRFICNCLAAKWDKLITREHFPFLKTTIIKNGFSITGEVKGWEAVIEKQCNYPVNMIKKHSQRVLELHENKYQNMNIYRKIRFKLLKNSPPEIRFCVVFIEKYLFIILNTVCFNKLKKF